MKEIKKESLKKLSKSNLINSSCILLIKIIINIFSFFLITLSVYSLSEYTFPKNFFLYTPLHFIAEARDLNKPLLAGLLILLSLFSFLAFIPLKMGTYLWFSKIKKDNKTSVLIIFHYYKNIKSIIKVISFKLLLLLRNFLFFLICFVPTVGTFLFTCSRLNSCPPEYQIILRLLIIASALTIFIGAFFFFKFQLMQIPAKFIFVIYESFNIFTLIRSANFLIHSNSILLIKLLASFYYYIFAIIFIIPIPFITTYFYTCLNEFTNKIIYKQNQGISSIPLTEKVIDINSPLLRF